MLYSAPGAYLDDGGVTHPVSSVEAYLPWNNSWVYLLDLPVIQHPDGSKYRMNQAPIRYFPAYKQFIVEVLPLGPSLVPAGRKQRGLADFGGDSN